MIIVRSISMYRDGGSISIEFSEMEDRISDLGLDDIKTSSGYYVLIRYLGFNQSKKGKYIWGGFDGDILDDKHPIISKLSEAATEYRDRIFYQCDKFIA